MPQVTAVTLQLNTAKQAIREDFPQHRMLYHKPNVTFTAQDRACHLHAIYASLGDSWQTVKQGGWQP